MTPTQSELDQKIVLSLAERMTPQTVGLMFDTNGAIKLAGALKEDMSEIPSLMVHFYAQNSLPLEALQLQLGVGTIQKRMYGHGYFLSITGSEEIIRACNIFAQHVTLQATQINAAHELAVRIFHKIGRPGNYRVTPIEWKKRIALVEEIVNANAQMFGRTEQSNDTPDLLDQKLAELEVSAS